MGRLARELGIALIMSPGNVTAVSLNGRVLSGSRPELMPFRLPLSMAARWSFVRTGIRLRRAYREARRWDRSGLTGPGDDLATYPASPALDGKTYADVLGPMHPDVAALMRVTANRLATEPDRLSGHVGTVDTVGIWDVRRPNVYGGTEEVPRALQRQLGDRIQLGTTVDSIEHDAGGVTVRARGNSGLETIRARACVVATPAPEVLRIVRDLPEPKAAALARISYGPFLVLGIFTTESGPMPWDAIYAMAVARRSFCMFFNPASVFRTQGSPRRAGGALVVYAAGDRAAALMDQSDDQIRRAYLADLAELFPGLEKLVAETVVQRWPLGVPVAAPGPRGVATAAGGICGSVGVHRRLRGPSRHGQRGRVLRGSGDERRGHVGALSATPTGKEAHNPSAPPTIGASSPDRLTSESAASISEGVAADRGRDCGSDLHSTHRRRLSSLAKRLRRFRCDAALHGRYRRGGVPGAGQPERRHHLARLRDAGGGRGVCRVDPTEGCNGPGRCPGTA